MTAREPTGAPVTPGERAPLTGLALGPRGVAAYAAFVSCANLALALLAASPLLQRTVRSIAVAWGGAGASAAARQLLAVTFSTALAALSYAVVVAPALAIAHRRGVRFADAFGLRRIRVWQTLALAAAVVVGGIAVTVAYSLLLRGVGLRMPDNTTGIVKGFGGALVPMVLSFVLVGLIAPFAEEIVFRGVLFGSLRRRLGLAGAALLSGVLFGIAHLDPLELVPLSLIGAALALVFARSRSLASSMIAHGAYNVAVLAIAFATVQVR